MRSHTASLLTASLLFHTRQAKRAYYKPCTDAGTALRRFWSPLGSASSGSGDTFMPRTRSHACKVSMPINERLQPSGFQVMARENGASLSPTLPSYRVSTCSSTAHTKRDDRRAHCGTWLVLFLGFHHSTLRLRKCQSRENLSDLCSSYLP